MDEEQVKILIVDDDADNLNVLLDCLHRSGYRVLIAPNGEQALQQVEYIIPDLILLDVMMPGIDGFETCRRLKSREETRDIPVIFMTALSDVTDKIHGFTVGGVDYITKPIQHEEVSIRVKTHVTLRKLQHDLRQQNQQFQEANASKDKFFSILAHDMRGPLAALRELPDIVLENVDQYTRDDLVNLMMAQREAAGNLYALLENLLTWARIQRGYIELLPQPLRLDHLIEQNIALLVLNAQQKQIAVHNTITTPLSVFADYYIVNTILRNLLSNAIKFTEAGGTIALSAKQVDRLVEIRIRDSGIGMTAEQIAQVFRIDAKFKRRGTAGEQGTGLGLILCHEFIKKHGGTISISSRPSQGTTLSFTLPVASE